jgi:magnesium transporter
LTELNFSNLLVRESLSEYMRILILLKRNQVYRDIVGQEISLELADLKVVSEHIQYNFDRLDDLKENINSKIELEQNRIFKILTMITVCISLPTLIAGIYGMNFVYMPELNWAFGYPLVLILLVISFILPLIYFRGKKWF